MLAAAVRRHFDASLPFELRCLEAALDGAISVMDIETITLEQHASPTLLRMAHKVLADPIPSSHLPPLFTAHGQQSPCAWFPC